MSKFKEQAQKVKKVLDKILNYVRITDEKNRLSLTNITMIIILIKIAMIQETTFTDITTLAIAVIGYQGKRQIDK